MKKTFLATAAVSLLTISLMTSCQNTSVTNNPITEENFAYQALTTVKMIGVNPSIQPKARISFKDSETEKDNSISLEESKATIESYLSQADLYLSNEQTPFTFTDLTSDKAEYQYKQGFTFTDLSNTSIEYVIYYNITASKDWTYQDDDVQADSSEDIVPSSASSKGLNKEGNKDDESEDDDKDDDKDNEDEDEDELSFKDGQMMEGIALFNEKTYKFQAKKTSLDNGSVTIESIGMRMTLEEGNYSSSVTTYYKIQTNANKTSEDFSYEVRENGEEVLEFEVNKPSNKNGKIELEINDYEYDIRKEDKFNGVEGDYLIVSLDDDESDIFLVYQRVVNEDSSITYVEVK